MLARQRPQLPDHLPERQIHRPGRRPHRLPRLPEEGQPTHPSTNPATATAVLHRCPSADPNAPTCDPHPGTRCPTAQRIQRLLIDLLLVVEFYKLFMSNNK